MTATPSNGLSRREVLARTATGAGIVLSGSYANLFGMGAGPAHAKGKPPVGAGYGPLVADPNGLLSLPEGFSYKIVAQSGVTRLETGEPTPSDPDGTAAFVRHRGNGSVLVNNHEVGGGEPYRVPALPGYTYDPAAGGGTTNIEVDKDGNRLREYVSLAGTHNNCAGGKSPWNTWLTCEEAESLSGQTKPHGYVFDVDPYDQDANRDPAADQGARPVRPRGAGRRPRQRHDLPDRGRRQPERAAVPLDAASLRAPAGQGRAEVAARRRRDPGGAEARRRWAARTFPICQWRPHPARPTGRAGSRCPTATPRQCRPANSSATHRSPAAASSRACGGATAARTSCAPSPASPTAVPRSTTARSGSWTRSATRSSSSCTSRTRRWTRTTTPTARTTSPCRRYGGLIIAEDGDGKSHLVGADEDGDTFFFARNEDPENSEFTGPDVLPGQEDPLRQRAIPGIRVRDPGTVPEPALIPGRAPGARGPAGASERRSPAGHADRSDRGFTGGAGPPQTRTDRGPGAALLLVRLRRDLGPTRLSLSQLFAGAVSRSTEPSNCQSGFGTSPRRGADLEEAVDLLRSVAVGDVAPVRGDVELVDRRAGGRRSPGGARSRRSASRCPVPTSSTREPPLSQLARGAAAAPR